MHLMLKGKKSAHLFTGEKKHTKLPLTVSTWQHSVLLIPATVPLCYPCNVTRVIQMYIMQILM